MQFVPLFLDFVWSQTSIYIQGLYTNKMCENLSDFFKGIVCTVQFPAEISCRLNYVNSSSQQFVKYGGHYSTYYTVHGHAD